MKRFIRCAMLTSCVLSLATLSLFPVHPSSAASDRNPPAMQIRQLAESREKLAYSLGIQAYLYGYPLVVAAKTRGDMTRRLAPLGEFAYSESLASPAFHEIVTPNSDTLYLNAWLDLSKSPVLLEVPNDPQNRYYTVQMLDAYTNTFHNESNRSTQQQARQSIIVGPGWSGPLPKHLKRIDAPTNTVWLVGRVEVKDKQDLPAALAFEKQIRIHPLLPSRLERSKRTAPAVPADALQSLSFYRVMTDMIRHNPPPACDNVLLHQFALAGIDVQAGFDPARLDPATRVGLQRALQDGPRIVQNGFFPYTTVKNGWGSFSPIGTYGDDFLARAYIAYSGLAANVPAEEAYFRALTDSANRPLSGAKKYLLHFDRDQIPRTTAFWSINVYTPASYLAQTKANRSSVRSNNGTLQLNPDGSLDIAIQQEPPKDKQVNWLPTPSGDFNLVLRIFAPEQGSQGPGYTLPPIQERS